MSEITRILQAIEEGEQQASEQLLPLVYEELRKLAAHKMAQEKPGQTLQATALVHEAYIRLVDTDKAQHWNSRGHFFVAAAEAMRRILIESARKKDRKRHGGGYHKISMDQAVLVEQHTGQSLLDFDEALEQLKQEEPDVAEVVKLRYYAGLTIEQTAECLGISVRTVNRHWAFAKARLYQILKKDDE